MGKFWDAEMRAAFLRNPVRFTAMISGYVIWYVLFAVLTVLIGGILVLAGKSDAWVDWWLPQGGS